MSERVILDPAEIAPGRAELDLTPWIAEEGPNWDDATVESYLAQLDVGETAVDVRYPNRNPVIPLRIQGEGDVSFYEARSAIQAKAALWQREGGWVKRVLSNGQSVYGTVVVDGLKLSGGWLQAHRDIDNDAELRLEMLPEWWEDWEELEVVGGDTGHGEWIGLVEGHRGDRPGRLRITVSEPDIARRLGLIAALRSRHYSPEPEAAMVYEAEAIGPLDLASLDIRAGASGGGDNVIHHPNLAYDWTPVCETPDLKHTGTARVLVRVLRASPLPVWVRFVWGVGDLTVPAEGRAQQIPGDDDWYILDLGEVRLDPAPTGSHRWRGQVQARGDRDDGVIPEIYVDKIWVLPVDEGYTKLSTPITTGRSSMGAYAIRDEFERLGTLGGQTPDVAPVFTNWLTSGPAVDFVGDGVRVVRATASDAQHRRAEIADIAAGVNIACRLDFEWGALPVISGSVSTSVFVQGLNIILELSASTVDGGANPALGLWSPSPNVVPVPPLIAGQQYSLILVAYDQFAFGWLTKPGVHPGPPQLFNTVANPAGGSIGFQDQNLAAAAITRGYHHFSAWNPEIDAIVHRWRQLELRSDGAFRQAEDAGGWGPTPPPHGDLLRLPPPGLEGRPVELLLKPSTGNFREVADLGFAPIDVTLQYQPTWLVVPGG